MQEDHPTPEMLEAWTRGELARAESREVVAHLLHGCPACSRALRQAVLPGRQPVDPSYYEMPIRRAYRRALQEQAAGAQASGELAALLYTGAAPSRSPVEFAGIAGWRWCEDLLDASRDLLREDPQGAVLLAGLAVSIADRLDEERFPAGKLIELRARARAELGNTRRAADDLDGAAADLAEAVKIALEAPRSPLLVARIMDLYASLLRAQRQLAEAGYWLDRIFGLYRKLGESHLAGRALISRGLILGEAQDYPGALDLLEQGLGMIDRSRDPDLMLRAVHSMIWFLAESGSFTSAEKLYKASESLYVEQAGAIDLVRARWVEGKIAAGLGELGMSADALGEARVAFAKHGMPYAVALVTLDLAAVYLRQGRPAEVGRLAEEMLATFRALGIRREAIAVVVLLQEAVQTERLTLALLEDLAREFRRLEA